MVKQPDKTRQQIVDAAFWEIHQHGFQAASVDRIVAGTGVTKGALYYHFPTKLALGYAVVDEVVRCWVRDRWLEPIRRHADPVEALREALRAVLSDATDEMIVRGCPLNNLVQEMSSVDEGFRVRLQRVLDEWRGGIAGALRVGQGGGLVRQDLDADAMAAFLVAAFEGISGVAKNTRDRVLAARMIEILSEVIESLRPVRAGAKREVATP